MRLPDDRPIVVAVTAGRGGLHANTIKAFKEKEAIRAVVYDACNNPTLTRDMLTFLSGPLPASPARLPMERASVRGAAAGLRFSTEAGRRE
jgi:hypothetical protein